MFCPKCGSKVEEGVLFCGSCGAKIIKSETAEQVQDTHPIQENVKRPVVEPSSDLYKKAPYIKEPVMTSSVNPEIEAVQKEDNQVSDQKKKQERNLGILIAIVSCFLPIAGLVVFINCRENSPKVAKIGGISAIVGVVVNIIIMLLVNSL